MPLIGCQNGHKQLFKATLIAIITCIIVVWAGYFFVDKFVAFAVYRHHLMHYQIFQWLTHIPELFDALTFLFYIYFAIKFSCSVIKKIDRQFLMMANSIVIAGFLKAILKMIFGRYWPTTWINNNPSLIQNGAYGFHLLHIGSEYRSFPSGHTAVTFAAMTIVWIEFPRKRWLAVIIAVLVPIGLLGMNYHFVTDIIAGGTLGAITACFVAQVMRAQQPSLK